MDTKEDIDREYKDIQDKLKPLIRKMLIVNESIVKYNKRLREIEEVIDSNYIKDIPSDPTKITDEQWAWILKAGHQETKAHYGYQKTILKYFGRDGFLPETEQVALRIQTYSFNKEGLISEFNLLKKHIIPHTFKDRYRGGSETGIRITTNGISEDSSSAIYILEDGSVALYTSPYASRQCFNDFPSFLDWYAEKLSDNEDSE